MFVSGFLVGLANAISAPLLSDHMTGGGRRERGEEREREREREENDYLIVVPLGGADGGFHEALGLMQWILNHHNRPVCSRLSPRCWHVSFTPIGCYFYSEGHNEIARLPDCVTPLWIDMRLLVWKM